MHDNVELLAVDPDDAGDQQWAKWQQQRAEGEGEPDFCPVGALVLLEDLQDEGWAGVRVCWGRARMTVNGASIGEEFGGTWGGWGELRVVPRPAGSYYASPHGYLKEGIVMRDGVWFGSIFLTMVLAGGIALGDEAPAGPRAATMPVTSEPRGSEHAATHPAQEAGGEVKASVTHHSIVIHGSTLAYTAIAGRMAMKDENDKPTADMFFVAYHKDTAGAVTRGSEDGGDSNRPITFCFNGGPGAASVWLHLGAVGPETVVLDEKGLPVGPPFRLADNSDTWLSSTDLVFVDPVSTGYSRAAKGEDPRQFHGSKEDVESVGDFIRLYLTKYQRWESPVYLAGESYGTTRAAALSKYLAERYGISANGIVLISSVLDFQTLSAGGVNDLPYALYLPSYAAVAWYHHKLGPQWQGDLQKTIDAARAFTTDVYLPALAKGSSLNAKDRADVIRQLSEFTSLPADLIDRSDLRIDPFVFEKSLLDGHVGHDIIGRFDGRITGYDPDAISPQPTYDPSETRYFPAYAATFNEYARQVLKYDSDLPYEVLTDRVWPWNYGKNNNGYLDVLDDLQSALVENPHMRVMFVSGYFDLATPFFSADYTIDRLKLPPELRGNVTHVYFPAGHMVYHEAGSKRGLSEDVGRFVGNPKSEARNPKEIPMTK